MKLDDYRDDVRCRLAALGVPPHAATAPEIWAGFSEGIPATVFAASFADWMADQACELCDATAVADGLCENCAAFIARDAYESANMPA